jgi:hypothetical protein
MEYTMPLRGVKPYKHQLEAFDRAMRLFGLSEGGDERDGNLQHLREVDSAQAERNSKAEQSLLQ